MIQGIFWKWVFKKIWGLIKDANDDRMAKSHHKRIKALEKQMKQIHKNTNNSLKYTEVLEKEVAILKKDSHSPVEGLEKRLLKLEKFKKEK